MKPSDPTYNFVRAVITKVSCLRLSLNIWGILFWIECTVSLLLSLVSAYSLIPLLITIVFAHISAHSSSERSFGTFTNFSVLLRRL